MDSGFSPLKLGFPINSKAYKREQFRVFITKMQSSGIRIQLQNKYNDKGSSILSESVETNEITDISIKHVYLIFLSYFIFLVISILLLIGEKVQYKNKFYVASYLKK